MVCCSAFPSYLRSFADRLGVQASKWLSRPGCSYRVRATHQQSAFTELQWDTICGRIKKSVVLTPLVFLLAGRNSPFIWMTGVDYPTLQLYHRWVARMAVYTALGHCIGYCFVYVIDNPTSFYESFHEAYWNWGWAALVGGLFLCLSSIRRVREICYEVFLLCHIGGAMLWLVGCYYHIYSLNPKYSFLKYLYATIAFWVFERATRTVWSSYYTFGKATSKGFQFGADAKIIECGSYSRLIINPARPLPDRFSGPGSYIFVRSVDGRFFESHPFTIAFPSGMPRLCSPAQTPDPEGKNTFLGSRGSQLSDNEDQGGKAFELIIRTGLSLKPVFHRRYSGWTRTLRDRTKPLKLLLEGPYGASTSLDHYDSALLIAGGSGISATIAHFADLAKCLDRAEGDYKLTLQRIVIVWAIRDPQSAGILVIYLARLRGLLGNINVDLHIYYTGEISSIQKIRGLSAFSSTEQLSCVRSSQGLLAITSICSPLTSMLKTLSIHTGRPDIVNYLDDLLSEGGKIGVIACGPEGLCDRARLGVKSRMRETTSDDLIYHEESFTW
ncbi:BQ2448_967 [Microbotryum intermedium]|uniref:BQ2448_967 protein n=1 Tax=Microbotryum intermedium TaxID=269621 RepID=A0A238FCN2_9BASI|nr:BQ2448_967 [Microbotryum intermedium]